MKLQRSSNWARLIVVCVGIAAPVIMTGGVRAQNIYIHSPSEEKAANTISERLTAAKTNHLAAIDRHRTFLQEALTRQRGLMVQRELSQRNAMIAEILEASDATDSPQRELAEQVELRLTEITGIPGDGLAALAATGERNLLSRSRRLERAQIEHADQMARLARTIREFEDAGGEGSYCQANGLPDPVKTADGDSPNSFLVIGLVCERLAQKTREMERAGTGLDPAAAALLGVPTDTSQLRPSEIRSAVEENRALAGLVDSQAALVKAAKSHLKQLEDYYKCQLERAAEPGAAADIQAAAERIRTFTEWVANLDTAAFLNNLLPDEPTEPPAPSACRPANGGPERQAPRPIDSSGELAREARLSPQHLRSLLAEAARVQPMRTLLAALREEVQDFKSTRLSELLAAAASPNAAGSPDERAAQAAFLLVDNLVQFQRARAGTLPDTAGVLVRLAAARMAGATARIEAERLQELKRLSDLRLAALRREALGLIAAYRLRASSFDRALLRYSDSWAEGRLPGRIIAQDMRSAEYLAWADRERVVIESTYAMLEPAVAQLQQYGTGGFRSSDLAQILSAIGVGAIAIGD